MTRCIICGKDVPETPRGQQATMHLDCRREYKRRHMAMRRQDPAYYAREREAGRRRYYERKVATILAEEAS